MGFWAVLVAIVEAIIEAAKVVAEVKKVIDALNSLSSGGLQALVQSVIAGEVVGAVARELGITGDDVGGAGAEQVADDSAAFAAQAAEEVVEASSDLAFEIDVEALNAAVRTLTDALFRGRAIVGGPDAVRNVTGAGDPIRLDTGEFEHSAVDLEIDGAGIPFAFERTYRSRTVYLGPLGLGWDHTYNLWLREEGPHVVMRLTGRLSEQRFVRHPRFGEAGFDYYAPPDGVHDILRPDGAGSFRIERPGGDVHQFEASDVAGEHRIRRIATRFGSRLDFGYDANGRLADVLINSDARRVTFTYDDRGRLRFVTDHAGRRVEYEYDDFGDLSCVLGPDVGPDQPRPSERYDYAEVGRRRQLVRVKDWLGRIRTENEYELSEVSEYLGWLIRQDVGGTSTEFRYERLAHVPKDPAAGRDTAVMRVTEVRGGGHKVEHLLNAFGNELHTFEQYVEGGLIRRAWTSYRYNADGEVIGIVDPEGSLNQFLYGRDLYSEEVPWPDVSPAVGALRAEDRAAFGNLLVTISRADRVAKFDNRLDPDFWTGNVPSARAVGDPSDIIHKYTFDPESQLPLTASDPRATTSPDPLHVESAPPGSPNHDPLHPLFLNHQAHLTRSMYGPAPRFELVQRMFPDRTRPSALGGVTSVTGIVERFQAHAPNGEPLERTNANGYWFRNELYPPSPDPLEAPKEGYLRSQLLPHHELEANAGAPAILEIRLQGSFDKLPRFVRSTAGGAAVRLEIEGDQVELFQSNDPTEIAGSQLAVGVTVDGNPAPSWDQSTNAAYLLEDLGPGVHVIELIDTAGLEVAFGRAVSHVKIRFDVDVLGRVTREIDGIGVETENVVDALGRVTHTRRGVAPAETIQERIHDPEGHVLWERVEWRDKAGVLKPAQAIIKRREYDGSGNLVFSSEEPEVGGSARRQRHHFDADDRVRLSIGPRGTRTAYAYDAIGREIRRIRAPCLPVQQTVQTGYDRAGNVLYEQNGRGALSRNGVVVAGGFRSGINAHGRTVLESDALGHIRNREYNALGKVVVERVFNRRPDTTFELLSRRETQYDEHGDATVVIDAIFTPMTVSDPIDDPDAEYSEAVAAGHVTLARTEMHLDAYGQVVAIRNPDGGVEAERFDGQGRSVGTETPDGSRLERILDGQGLPRRTYRYEPRVDPSTGTVTGTDVFVQEFQHDVLGRETARMDPYGNTWTREYDALGNLTRTANPLGNVVLYDYSVFGEPVRTERLRTSTSVGGGPALPSIVEERAYDAAGNLTVLKDGLGRRIEIDYDPLDRRVALRWVDAPGAPEEQREYDRADNLSRVRLRSGIVKDLTYDLLDRHVRTDVEQSDAAAPDQLWVETPLFREFEHDALGNVVRHENDYCRVDVQRDSTGRAVSERVTLFGIPGAPGPQTIGRTFDVAGWLVELVFPSGRRVKLLRDPLGRLAGVRNVSAPDYPGRPGNDTGFDVARFQYSGRRLVRAAFGNGLTLAVRHEGRGLVLDRRLVRPDGTTAWRTQVLRGPAGKVRRENRTTPAGDETRKHFFDSLGQLVAYNGGAAAWLDPATVSPASAPVASAANAGQAVLDAAIGTFDASTVAPSFTYDAVGNRLQTDEPGLTPFPTVPNALDLYQAVDGTPWVHDTDGRVRSDGTLQFEYDLNGSTAQVSDAGGERAAFFRDAMARIVAVREPTGTTFTFFDSERPLLEIGPGEVAEFVPDQDERRVLHVARAGEDHWITYDGVGSLRAATDGGGALIAAPVYRPYGELQGGVLPTGLLAAGFGGMRPLPGTPLYLSAARGYRTDVGRHLQPDPAGIIEGPQLYPYGANDPVGSSDPTGTLVLIDDILFWGIGRLTGLRSDSFLSGVGQSFVESWSLVLGTFNTFKGAKDVGDVMWGVLKLAHKLTLGLPQEIAGILAGYGAIELMGAETELWQNVQLIKVPGTSFGAFTLGSRVIGDPTSLSSGPGDIRLHEQGHFYQNLVLGPLYLPAIGIPSIIHAGIHTARGLGHGTYGHFYTEGWADAWSSIGHVPSGKQVAAGIGIGLGVAAAANLIGLIDYEAQRRRDLDRARRVDPLLRLSTEQGSAFERPLIPAGPLGA